MLKRILTTFFLSFVLCAFSTDNTLTGTWEYCGGIYNGKAEQASKDYTLQRQYGTAHYNALFIERGAEPISYEKAITF